MDNVGTIFTAVCTKDIFAKCLGAIVLVISNFLLDGLLMQAMLSLIVLIIFDYITAMMVVYKFKKPITSRLTFRTPVKIAIYFLLISAGNISENAIPTVLHLVDETIIAFLVLTELISVMENIGKMGYAIPMRLLNKLQEVRGEK